MANTFATRTDLRLVSRLVGGYVAIVVATIAVLALLSALHSNEATSAAWVHAAIVAVFAVLMPLRLRAARRGSVRGRRAVTLVAAVLLVVNVVEAVVPGLFPMWMRIEMIAIALLMTAIVAADLRARP